MLSLKDIRVPLAATGATESRFGESAEAEGRKFADRYSMNPPSLLDFQTMSRFLYPHAVSRERLAVTCMLHNIFFFVDDLLVDEFGLDPGDFGIDSQLGKNPEKRRKFLVGLVEAFGGGECEVSSSVHSALKDLGGSMRRMSDERWFEEFTIGLMDYIQSIFERRSDYAAVPGGLEKFLETRLRDTGGLHTCQLIEFTGCNFLSEGERSDPEVRIMTGSAIGMASLVNDIFSYHKDVVVEGSDFNLIKLMEKIHACDFTEAVDRSVRLVNSYTRSFDEQSSQISGRASRALRSYATGLADMMAGNLAWHWTSNRYRSPESPFAELTSILRSE